MPRIGVVARQSRQSNADSSKHKYQKLSTINSGKYQKLSTIPLSNDLAFFSKKSQNFDMMTSSNTGDKKPMPPDFLTNSRGIPEVDS